VTQKQHPLHLVAYFVLVYAVAWLVWGSRLAAELGLLPLALPENLAFLGVTVAALVAAALGGRGAFGLFLRRFARWRVGLRWYAAALLLPPLLNLTPMTVHALLGGKVPRIGQFPQLALQTAGGYLLFEVGVCLLTEEAGWRGYALPSLQARLSPFSASLVLGVLGAGWSVPPFFWLMDTPQILNFAGFLTRVVAISLLITWIFDGAGGSVPMAALFRASLNTSVAVTGALTSGPALYWTTTAVMWIAALTVLVGARPWFFRRIDESPDKKRTSERSACSSAY
jgi:uncharacterized protein